MKRTILLTFLLLLGLMAPAAAVKNLVVEDSLGPVGGTNPLPVREELSGRYELGVFSATAPIEAMAGESAGVAVFAALNTGGGSDTVDAYVVGVVIQGNFVGVAHASLGAMELQRFTVAVPSGGTAVTAGLLDSAVSPTGVTNIRYLSTGVTMTSAAYGGTLGRLDLNDQAGQTGQLVLDLSDAPIRLRPNEGLALRCADTMRNGQRWTITLIWGESED